MFAREYYDEFRRRSDTTKNASHCKSPAKGTGLRFLAFRGNGDLLRKPLFTIPANRAQDFFFGDLSDVLCRFGQAGTLRPPRARRRMNAEIWKSLKKKSPSDTTSKLCPVRFRFPICELDRAGKLIMQCPATVIKMSISHLHEQSLREPV